MSRLVPKGQAAELYGSILADVANTVLYLEDCYRELRSRYDQPPRGLEVLEVQVNDVHGVWVLKVLIVPFTDRTLGHGERADAFLNWPGERAFLEQCVDHSLAQQFRNGNHGA